jgi:D-sedoheptulose 7-phosphate isomerase
MLEQRIQQHFFESADLQYRAGEALVKPIAEAANAIVGALTGGGKLMVGGLGRAVPLAQWIVTALADRFERDRPGLAAMLIGADAAQLAALAMTGHAEASLLRPIETLGQPGDLLLLIACGPAHPGLRAVVGSAQSHDMSVIALTGDDHGALVDTLGETDVLIAVPESRPMRVAESQLLVLNSLCDAIDYLLLGEQDLP